MNTKTFICWAALTLGIASAVSAQASWGDNQGSGVRESASTGLFTPARAAFDGNLNTAWQLAPGSTSGWADRYWNQSQRLAGASVTADLPAGVTLQLSSLQGNEWVPIPGAVTAGPVSGTTTLTFAGELLPTNRLLVTLQGAGADQAKVWEVTPATNSGPVPYGKILPQSYSINQNEYINLKASRLWDGINGNSWFSPLWSLPQEAFQTDGPDQPSKIFPPYFGNPPKDAEIIWQLDGAYLVQTLKVFFVQNYQSIEFQFWDGSQWSSAQTFGPGWSDSGSGWQRIDLKTPVMTTKIRITFPGGWNRANAIGELEVWGQGFNGTPPQALVIPSADTDGSYHLTWTTPTVQDEQLEVTVAGQTAASLTGEWNAAAFSAAPATWIGGDTVYRVPIAKETLRSDTQFLKLVPPGTLHSVVMRDGRGHGQIDWGWPYDDGQFSNTQAGPTSAVLALKDKTWALSPGYQLEKLRVYSGAASPGTFQTGWKGHASPVNWTNQGSGWWEASLSGLSADELVFHSPVPVVLDEIQLWGSALADTKVGMEIWWPQNPVAATSSDGSSVIGWMGDPSVLPLIGGYHPRQADKLFWMPLAQMGLASGQSVPLIVQGTLGSAGTTFPVTLLWPGNSPVGTLDQGTSLAATTQSAMTLSGTLGRPNLRVFVQGAEVIPVGGKFSTSVALKDGFQLLDVEIWDKPKMHLEAQFIKPVYRTVGQPLLQFDLPPGDLWTQGTSLPLSGLVGNGTGLSLTLNGTAVPLTGNVWGQLQSLAQGTHTLSFVLKDNAGRETDQTLTVNQDSVAPALQFTVPVNGAYLNTSAVNLQIAGNQPQYWYSLNSGAWTPAYTQNLSLPTTLSDGFYTYTAAAQDRAGNIGATASVSFCVDTTPPASFTIAANVSGWTNNNQPTLTFATTDATSGVDHYEYAVDSGGFTAATSPLQLPVLADGAHTVFVKAVDKAGNATLENMTLSIDTATPATPTNLTAVPGASEIDLSWGAVTEPGVLASLPITYQIERNPAWSDGVHSSTSTSYVDTAVTNGSSYSYRVTAVDVAGNRGVVTGWVSMQAGFATQAVNPNGPTIVNFNQAALTVPTGAASADVVSFLIAQLPPADVDVPPVQTQVSPVFRFIVTRSSEPVNPAAGHADFSSPVSVQLSYDPSLIPQGMSEANLKPYYFDELWSQWRPINDALVDRLNHQVYFKTNHFTDFSVQATPATTVTPQQLRDKAPSPLGSPVAHQPVTVSPQNGVVSTAFTEFHLPGKGGFDLDIQRVYSSAQAQSDASDALASGSALGTDGSAPWKLGPGWRLNFPYLKWNANDLWVTDPDGRTFSFGQMALSSTTGSDGQQIFLTFSNHESGDATVIVTINSTAHHHQDQIFGIKFGGSWTTYTYALSKAQLLMKDGREVDFDGAGRVTAMRDAHAAVKNFIGFDYSDPKATKITDTLGRVVTVSYSGKSVSSIIVTAGNETTVGMTASSGKPMTVTYKYPSGYLSSATDAGGRTWNYVDTPFSVTTSTHVTSSGYTDPPAQTLSVLALTSASGPGLGTTTIGYQVASGTYTSSEEVTSPSAHIDFTVSQGVLAATSVTTSMASGSSVTVRSVQYGYTFASGENQVYVSAATVSDGRMLTTTTYSHVSATRTSLSTAPDALTQSVGATIGVRPDTHETRNYPQTTTIANIQTPTSVSETRTLTWDWDTSGASGLGRVLTDTTSRGPSNTLTAKYLYDTWGNVTQVQTGTSVPVGTTTRQTFVEDDYSYYNTHTHTDNDSNLYLDLPDQNVTWNHKPSGSASVGVLKDSNFHSLMAAHVRTINSWSPAATLAGTGRDLSVVEKTAFFYDNAESSNGRLTKKEQWTGSQWATTTYSYDNTSAELTSVSGPLANQETDYSYAYSGTSGDLTLQPSDSSYQITTKQRNINLGASTQDIVTANTYDALTGANTDTSVDQNGLNLHTSRTFDPLSRVLTLTEPAVPVDTAGTMRNPVTTTSYVDALGSLSATVIDPLHLTTTYSFDDLGRLTEVKKDSGTETIDTQLTYDSWNDLLSLAGPWSSKETTRTLAALTTSLGYDFRGRVTSVLAPAAQPSVTPVPKTSSYDDAHNLVTSYDELGRETDQVLDWNGNPLLTNVYPSPTKPLSTSIYYDGLGRVIASVDPMNQETDHSYGPQGLEIKVVAPSRSVTELNPVTGLLQSANVSPETDKVYDAAGNLVTVTQPLATGIRVTNSVPNFVGQVLSTTANVTVGGAASIIQHTYSYDTIGDRLSDTSGYADAAGKFITSTSQSWTYDSHGRVQKATDENGKITQYTYDTAGNRTGVIDPRQGRYPGNFTLGLTYDRFGRLVNAALPSADGSAPTLQFAYDGNGNLIQRTEQDGQITAYAYTLRNQLAVETRGPLVTQYTYDASGWDSTKTLPSGHVTKSLFDGAHRLVEADENGLMSAQYGYDDDGNRTAVTDGNGNTTKTLFNPEGQPTIVTDALGKITTTNYDRWGNVTQTIDPLNNARTYQYDEVNRLIQEKTPWGAQITTSYDAWGDPTNRKDARGTVWTRSYTPTHLLDTETGINGAQTLSRSFTYDDAGDLKTATDNGILTAYNSVGGTYQPDPYSMVRAKTDSVLGQALTMGYSYDAKQRLTDVTYPDASTVHYGYNTLDQITSMPNWINGQLNYDSKSGFLTGYTLANQMTTGFSYDARDRIQSLGYSANGNSVRIYSLTYDNASNVIGKNQNVYSYDKLNRLVGANEKGLFQQTPADIAAATQFTTQDSDYHPTTQVLSFTTTIQPTDVLKLDIASRSIGVDLGAAYQVNRLQIAPSNASNRVRQQDLRVYASADNVSYAKITGWQFTQNSDGSMSLNFPSPFTARYLKVNTVWDDRDPLNVIVDKATFANTAQALVQVWTLVTSKSETYGYDDSGNRTSQTVALGLGIPAATTSKYYQNSSNGNLPWLAYDGRWYYQYDAAGNRIARAKALLVPQDRSNPVAAASFQIDTTQEYWNYSWDLKNRLSSVSKNGVLVASYAYDAENLRVARVTSSDTKVFAFGRNGAIAYTKDVTANTARTYTYLNDSVIGWTDTHADATQSTYYATTDHLGSVTGVTDNHANLVWSSEYDPFGKASGVVSSYAFDGSYAGHEVDADTGLVYMWNRWQDPDTGTFISEDPAQDGGNWYSYAYSSPLNYIDRTGLDPNGADAGLGPGGGSYGPSAYGGGGSSGGGGSVPNVPGMPSTTPPPAGWTPTFTTYYSQGLGMVASHNDGNGFGYQNSIGSSQSGPGPTGQINSDAGGPNNTPEGPIAGPPPSHSGPPPSDPRNAVTAALVVTFLKLEYPLMKLSDPSLPGDPSWPWRNPKWPPDGWNDKTWDDGMNLLSWVMLVEGFGPVDPFVPVPVGPGGPSGPLVGPLPNPWPFAAFADKGKKGKDFRGGKKGDRDKWYGYDKDPDFVKWWHREGKDFFGGNDIDNAEEAKAAYDEWVSLGKPRAK